MELLLSGLIRVAFHRIVGSWFNIHAFCSIALNVQGRVRRESLRPHCNLRFCSGASPSHFASILTTLFSFSLWRGIVLPRANNCVILAPRYKDSHQASFVMFNQHVGTLQQDVVKKPCISCRGSALGKLKPIGSSPYKAHISLLAISNNFLLANRAPLLIISSPTDHAHLWPRLHNEA